MTDYEIVLADTFQSSLQSLDAGHQVAVLEAIDKLRKGHASVHLHALSPLPWVSFGANRDALRIICWRESATLVLAWVDLHDAAYRWAERHAPRQFGKVIRFAKTVVDEVVAPTTSENEVPPGPLASVRDKVFRAFGVTPRLAGALRALPDDDVLLELCERVDKPLAEALLALAADPDATDTTIARYHEAKSASAQQPTLADAVRAPINAERMWVASPEQRALEAALAGSAAAWSVFLHPMQKRLVTARTSGPFLVTGGPGTGKTVVALHRARFLAESESHRADPRPILVTTFSRVLASQLESNLALLCRDAPAMLDRIVTLTLVAASTAVLKAAKVPHAVLVSEDIDAAWNDALAKDTAGLGRRFYEQEREDVVLAHGIITEDAYLRAARTGRKGKLDRAKKKVVWSVLDAFEAALARRGGDDAGGLARKATQLLRDGKVQSPFSAIICDEVQDANRWQLRLLAALACNHGDTAMIPAPDRLFLVGDGHQRLYEKPVSLHACGIEVRGRSARLRLNYRTTQGICTAALQTLDGVDLDVIERDDANFDANFDATGYRSLRAGKRPSSHAFKTADEEADFIASAVRSTPARPLLILARTKTMLGHLADRLRARGVTPLMLGDADLMPATGDHVVLATFHRSKGLEAPTVILAGMQESPLRFPGGTDEERALHLKKERLLVYVGMTRARDACTMTRVV